MLYYHKVVRGKAPKNAPTYLPEVDGKDTPSTEEKKTGKMGLPGMRLRIRRR